MNAMIHSEQGSVDDVQFQQVDCPTLKTNEVLIQVNQQT